MTNFTTLSPVSPLVLRAAHPRPGPKTVILAGLSRSGTSASAAALNGLGVHLGETHDGHFETVVFKTDPFDPGHWGWMQEYIDCANEEWLHWGTQTWLNPQHIARIAGAVRNPHLILVNRDPAAIIQRHAQTGEGEYGGDLEALMFSVPRLQALLWAIAQTSTLPTMLLSFERLRVDTEQTIIDIADFLELSPTDEQYETAQSSVNRKGGYLIQEEGE